MLLGNVHSTLFAKDRVTAEVAEDFTDRLMRAVKAGESETHVVLFEKTNERFPISTRTKNLAKAVQNLMNTLSAHNGGDLAGVEAGCRQARRQYFCHPET